MAAEYVLAGGNTQVILCERGIRTFETALRNTLDLSAVPVLHAAHAPAGHRRSLARRRRARQGAADGAAPPSPPAPTALLIEVHPHPEKALSDGAQSLDPPLFEDLMRRMRAVARAVGREL